MTKPRKPTKREQQERAAVQRDADAIGRLLRAVLGDGKRVKVNPWDTKRKRKR